MNFSGSFSWISRFHNFLASIILAFVESMVALQFRTWKCRGSDFHKINLVVKHSGLLLLFYGSICIMHLHCLWN